MSIKSVASRPALRKWLASYRFFDTWFILMERSRAAFQPLLDFGWPAKHRLSQRRRRNYLPQVEGMELRILMDADIINFFHASDSVNYNASLVDIGVEMSGDPATCTVTVDYATEGGGDAVAGTDFTAISGDTLSFVPGVTDQVVYFTVPILGYKRSSDVSFMLGLTDPDPSFASLGDACSESVTILDTPAVNDVVDLKSNVVLPANGTPINSFANWNMSLAAELGGANNASYSWSFAGASDATSISSTITYDPTFTWGSFTGTRTDTISLTETAQVAGTSTTEELTQNYIFEVLGTDSNAWASSSPTTMATWPSALGPDQLNGQGMVPAGPYAEVGQVDGSAQTSFSLPGYNPNAVPLGLDYNSAVADSQPVFMVDYQLSSSSLPTTVNATLTLNGYTETIYYDPTQLNTSDTMEIALQPTTTMLNSLGNGDRYLWNISMTTTPSSTTVSQSGYLDFVKSSTTPTSLTADPFGPGWSLDDVTRLWPVTMTSGTPVTTTNGVIIQNPDGTSLWFSGSGSYTSPAGDFSTLSYSSSVYTRTMPDGTKFKYNSSGEQTAIIDRNGNTTTFAYNGSGQLTSVEDVNGAYSPTSYTYSTITYDGTTGLASKMANPSADGRALTLTYSSTPYNELTGITDPGSNVWTYAYDTSNRLTKIKDPRSTGSNFITTLTYNSSSQVGSVSQPDGTTLLFAAEQLTGLATGGTGTSGDPAPAALAAAAVATYTDPNSQTWTEYFDGLGFGRLVETVDPLGDTLLAYRDANGLAWLSADALGRGDRFFFDSHGNVVTLVNADNSYSTASFTNFAELYTLTEDSAGGTALGTTTYSYDSNGNLTSVEDALANTTTYTYTTSGVQGLLLTVTKPLAATYSGYYTTTYAYDSLNRVSTVTEKLPSGNVVETFTYDTYGDVATTTNPDSVVTTYAYNHLGQMTTMILADSSGVVSTYTYAYDAAGNLTSEVMPLTSSTNATYSYAYDSMNQLTKVTDALSNVTTYSHDAAGNLTGVTNALRYTTTYAFDGADRLTAVTIPITSITSATTTYTLDSAGEVTSVENAVSQTTSYSYNDRGWLASVTNPLGDVTSYSYDAIGDETSVTQTDTASHSVVTTMTYYDDTGLLESTTDPLSYVTTYSYDADYNLTVVNGNSQSIQNITYTYDHLDRLLTKDNDGGTTTYGYDNAGNLTTVTDPLSNVTSYTYDKQGRLLTEESPLSQTTSYTYNLSGWLTSVTDPDGNTTTYSYNADGWLTATAVSNTTYTASYSYDNIGELTAATDFNGRQTTYSYNRAGWRTGETWVSGGYTATYSYDNAGELTAAADSNSTYTFTYYGNGQVHQTAVSYPGLSSMGTVTLTYGYDGFGNRTSLVDSAGGGSATTTYTYNNNFQLASLAFHTGSTNADLSFSYDSSIDAVSTITMTGGSDTITAGYTYGTNTIGIKYADGTTTFAIFNYTLNNEGQVTTYNGPAGTTFANGTLTYAYDGSGELTGVTGAETYTYSFDGNGNRNSTGYTTSTGNEMVHAPTAGGTTYGYDNEGNLTSVTDSSGNVWTYTWDYRDRLTQVVEKNSGGTTLVDEQFTYDVFNNLIGDNLTVPTITAYQRWTVFDGKNPYIDFNGSGTLTTRYLTNPDAIDQFYARVSGGGAVDWYFTDLTGSIREIVSNAGVVQDQINYDPFGNIIFLYETSSGDSGRFKFDGGEYDSNLNLYRFGDRWNDPANGRWISQDPAGLAGGDANLYRFINNDPVNFSDPTGESASVLELLRNLSTQVAAPINIPNGESVSVLELLGAAEVGQHGPTVRPTPVPPPPSAPATPPRTQGPQPSQEGHAVQLRNGINDNTIAIGNLNANVLAILGQANSLRQSLTTLQQDLTAAQGQLRGTQNIIAQQESVFGLNNANPGLYTDIGTYQTQINNVGVTIAQVQAQIQALQHAALAAAFLGGNLGLQNTQSQSLLRPAITPGNGQ